MDKTIFPECDHPNSESSDHESTKSANDIRQDIADFVITHADKMSEVSGVKEFVAEHTHRSKEIIEAKKRLKRLATAKEKYVPLEKRVDACRKTLKHAETEFTKMYRPLGQTAFQAFIGGILEEQATFSERLTVFKRVQELQQKCDDLTSDPDTGFAQKAKAKAKQLTIKGTIKFEKMKVGKLDAKIGRQLVEADAEKTVRCDMTSELLEQIANHRESLTDCKMASQYAESALTKLASKLCEAIPLQTIENSKTFDSEIKLCKKTIREAESSVSKSVGSLIDELAETDPTRLSDSLVQRLGEVKSSKNEMTERMRQARKGISRYSSKTAVSVKRWWRELSQRGKAITTVLVIICLIMGVNVLRESYTAQLTPIEINKTDSARRSDFVSSDKFLTRDGDRVRVLDLVKEMNDADLPSDLTFAPDKQLINFAQNHVDSEKRVFALLDLPVTVTDVNPPSPFFETTKNTFVYTSINLRLHGESRGSNLISLCRANITMTPWFLKKDGSLKQCRDNREAGRVMRLGGTLYFPEAASTRVFLTSIFDKDIKQLRAALSGQFTMDVIFDGLRYGTEADWGFYNHRELIQWNWHSDFFLLSAGGTLGPPQYFRPKGVQSPKYVVANIVAVVLRDQSMLPIYGYRRPKDRRNLVLPQPVAADLIHRLEHEEFATTEELRKHISRPLGRLGDASVVELCRLLQSPETKRRILAAAVLSHLGPNAVSARKYLLKAIEDREPVVRAQVVNALMGLGIGDSATLRVLETATKDRDTDVRVNAIYALAKVSGEESERSVPTIIRVLRNDSDAGVRASAVYSLMVLGHYDEEVGSALRFALNDEFDAVHINAANAIPRLCRGNADSFVPDLVGFLTSENKVRRQYAAYALAEIGPPAKAAIPALEKSEQRELFTIVANEMRRALRAIREQQ